jgi:hypothetical protein
VVPADGGDPGDPDTLDDGVVTGLAGGDADCPALDLDEADPDKAGPGEADPGEADPGEADVLGWADGLGVNCVQAAMTTRSLAGSALPPTPLRSTK